MLIYWIFWFSISLFTFLTDNKNISRILFFILFFILFLFVGFRFEIGVDRDDYLKLYQYIGGLTFKESLTYTDLGYGLLNYISQKLNFKDLIFVNVICASIVFFSFYKLSVRFKYFFVPLLVGYTYFIVVVSMNYTRQSVSISLVMLGMLFLINKNNFKFILCLIFATLFHKTAIVFIVFYPLYYFNKFGLSKVYYGIYVFLSFIFITSILYLASVSEANIYVSQGEISSSGAIFRSMFHVFPVFLYLYFRSFFKSEYHKSLLILDYMMLLVLYCIALSFVFSTLSDRFNLYLMFFDIMVYTKLCEKLSLFGRNILFSYLFLFFSITFYIWFEFGEWAEYGWIPYQNYIVNYLSNVF